MKSLVIFFIAIAAMAKSVSAMDSKGSLYSDYDVEEWAKKRIGEALSKAGSMEFLARKNAIVRDLPIQSEIDELFDKIGIDKKKVQLVESFGFNAWYVARHQLSPSFDIIIAGSEHKSKRVFNVSDIFVVPHHGKEFGAPFYARHRWKEITFADKTAQSRPDTRPQR